jgi:hypothetical protein
VAAAGNAAAQARAALGTESPEAAAPAVPVVTAGAATGGSFGSLAGGVFWEAAQAAATDKVVLKQLAAKEPPWMRLSDRR